eukprot:1600389-Prorocentrum_lima.AAC.1
MIPTEVFQFGREVFQLYTKLLGSYVIRVHQWGVDVNIHLGPPPEIATNIDTRNDAMRVYRFDY